MALWSLVYDCACKGEEEGYEEGLFAGADAWAPRPEERPRKQSQDTGHPTPQPCPLAQRKVQEQQWQQWWDQVAHQAPLLQPPPALGHRLMGLPKTKTQTRRKPDSNPRPQSPHWKSGLAPYSTTS